MRYLVYLLLFSITIYSCEPDDISPPVILDKDYGEGIYILTDEGVTYYDYNSPDSNKIISHNIFSTVNSENLINPKSLEISGSNVYILTQNSLIEVDIETFEKQLEVYGFTNAEHCKLVKFERVYVSDKEESLIKVVDLNKRDITSHVETGDGTYPSLIVTNWRRAFVLNSGDGSKDNYDSTIVSIDYKDGAVPLNEFSGNIIVGKNPVSAIKSGNLKVLCKGIYDVNNPSYNTSSSIYEVGDGSLTVLSQTDLNNIFNADNLITNNAETKYFITANGGVYQLNSAFGATQIISNKEPTILSINREPYYNPLDSTNIQVEYLYMNDKNNDNYIYKYSLFLDQFVDSIPLTASPIDIKCY